MTVLVVYNDSPQGEAAFHAAAAEAVRRETGLRILVLNPRAEGAPTPAALAHLIDGLPPGFPPPPLAYRDPDIDPADAILDEAELLRPELVVIGTRKRSHVGKFLLGTTTQRVLLDSPAPVLVIKAKF